MRKSINTRKFMRLMNDKSLELEKDCFTSEDKVFIVLFNGKFEYTIEIDLMGNTISCFKDVL